MKTARRIASLLIVILIVCSAFASCELPPPTESDYGTEDITQSSQNTASGKFDLSSVPEYSGKAYVAVNSNKPYFKDSDVTTKPFEKYSALDSLGRCGVAYANVCREIMPTEKRGDIYSVKPTGWQHVEYDFVDGLSLYNRCHLIAHSLAGEDANEKNLITGTRYFNTEGMLPFENMVCDYVKETGNHVLYRVTPVFEGANLIATGVLMEGYSVEDGGEGIEFCVFCYNLQPGVEIDYSNGKSRVAEKKNSYSFSSDDVTANYVLNEKTKKFHTPDCPYVEDIAKENRKTVTCRRGDLVDQGYVACGGCKP